MKKTVLIFLLALLAAPAAQAGDWRHDRGHHYGHRQGYDHHRHRDRMVVRYVQPRPVVVQPYYAPAYYEPRPVYVQPRPVYYAPRPLFQLSLW